MTMRQRMLAVLRGEPHDRIPFVQYSGLAAPDDEVWALLGRDRCGLLQWVAAAVVDTPHCRFETEAFQRDGVTGYRRTMHTPAGSLTEEKLREPTFGSHATHRFMVREPADYRVLIAYLRDAEVRPNRDGVAEVIARLGDDGLPHTTVLRTAYQQLWVQWVSLDDLCLHLVDEPELMAEVTGLLDDVQRRIFDCAVALARELPIPHFVFPDNIHAPAIGPRYFRQYCLPRYAELAERLDAAGLDIPVHVHLDGDLQPLWSAIDESVVRGIDSLSPPPDNDTSVADAVGRWPAMRVFPNFPSSVHLRSDEGVYEVARQLLSEGGASGRFWIQISENVPPFAWRTSYPAICRAIDDYGAP